MKKLIKSVLNFFLIATYPVILVGLLVSGVFLYLNNLNLQKTKDSYSTVVEKYSLPEGKDIHAFEMIDNMSSFVDELYKELDMKNKEITSLEEKIKEGKKEGYGEIKGEILAFVTQGSSLNRYQRVCAQLKANESKLYCTTVSVLQKNFSLLVPEGEYYVFAEFPDDLTKRAYYTDFVKCNESESNSQCSDELSKNKITVQVKSGQLNENINPIDWQTIMTNQPATNQ